MAGLQRMRRAGIGTLIVLLTLGLHAQQVRVVQPAQPEPPPDTRAGTGAITGTVVDAATHRPVAGAIVTLEERQNGLRLRSFAQVATPKGRFAFLARLQQRSSGVETTTGAVATFTDRHTELSGTLRSAVNVPASDYFVVVFSPDRTLWRPASRRVQFTRPSTDGHFAIRDLPAGDDLIAALTDMEPSDLADASFLARLVPAALPVHLDDGETKTQNLTLAR